MTVLISLTALVGLFPQTANAATTPTPYLSETVTKAATLNTERNSLALCVAGGTDGTTSAQDIANLKWFNPSTQVRQWFDYTDGARNGGVGCDSLNLSTYLRDLGWNSNLQAACDLGLVRSAASEKNNCVNGNSSFNRPGTLDKQTVLNNIDKVYKGVPFGNNYTSEQSYVMAMKILTNPKACQASATGIVSGASADLKTKADAAITVVSADGSSVPTYYTFGGDQGTSWGFSNKPGNDSTWNSWDCHQLATIANNNSSTYARWVQQNLPGSNGNAGTCEQYAATNSGGGIQSQNNKGLHDIILKACNDGQTNKAIANYCSQMYPSSNGVAASNACAYGVNSSTTNDGSPGDPSANDTAPTCGISGIGWLVCPVMNFMAKVNDAIYGFLSTYFLSIDTGLVTHSQPAWAKFRDIANVAFVIAILFIVYSQITSVGLNNYGVKKMLPRLIVAALLVNISFYICAAAVDLSNVIGYAIPQFFDNIVPLGGPMTDTGGSVVGAAVAGVGWTLIIGGVVAGAVGVALAISVPVLLAALLAIALVVLMLIGRQAFIILLIVISPLAFVAYLLPNTEQWFKKWYKAFFALLMLFPIVGAVFGASRMAANIIYNSAAASDDKTIMGIIALAVSAVPFFVVPGLLKGSLAAAGTLGTKMGNMTGKAVNKVGARAKDSSYTGAYMAQRKRLKATKRAQDYGKGVHGKISNAGISGRAGSELATTGSALSSREEKEAVDNEVVAMQKQDGWTQANTLKKAKEEFVSAMKSGNSTKARAAQQILLGGGTQGISNLQSGFSELGKMDDTAYGSMMNDATGQKVLSDLNGSGIKGKNAALNQLAHTAPVDLKTGKKTTVDALATSGSTYDGLNDAELAGQSDDNLDNAIANQGLTQDRAQRMRSNDTVWSQLSETKKQKISAVAGPVVTAAAAAQPSASSPSPQSSPQVQLNIPHNGPAPVQSAPTATPVSQTTIAGTSNFTQTASGLYVPPPSSTPAPAFTPTTPTSTTTPPTTPPTQPPSTP